MLWMLWGVALVKSKQGEFSVPEERAIMKRKRNDLSGISKILKREPAKGSEVIKEDFRLRCCLLYNTKKQGGSTEGSCYDKYHYSDI